MGLVLIPIDGLKQVTSTLQSKTSNVLPLSHSQSFTFHRNIFILPINIPQLFLNVMLQKHICLGLDFKLQHPPWLNQVLEQQSTKASSRLKLTDLVRTGLRTPQLPIPQSPWHFSDLTSTLKKSQEHEYYHGGREQRTATKPSCIAVTNTNNEIGPATAGNYLSVFHNSNFPTVTILYKYQHKIILIKL